MMKTLANLSSMSDNVVSVTSVLLTQSDSNNNNNNNELFSALGVKSHGTITFSQNQLNKANFVRISSSTSAMKMKEYFIRVYCNQCPSIVISIRGSANEHSLRSKLLRIFQENLLKKGGADNIWILTNGMNTNLTKLIGEIIRTNADPSRHIHLIGIANYKSISYVDQFDVHGENVFYEISKTDQKDETFLEPNHTEFIFIDDGIQHKDDGELQFRARFERAISNPSFLFQTVDHQNKATLQSEQSVFIPVVLLVIEGDLNTVQQVHQSVVENNIPVVFLQGSGKSCDLFAKIYYLYNEYHQNLRKWHEKTNDDRIFQVKQNEIIKNKIRQKVEMTSINRIDYFQLIYECIETHQIFLNFVNLKTRNQVESDVDLAILKALLIAISRNDLSKNNIEQKQEQLNLALEWNRVDIVKNFIMKNERDWEKIDLNNLFEKALIRNQIDFVQLFLDHDFSLDDFFKNNNKLLMLYKNQVFSLKDDSIDPLRTIYTQIIQPLVSNSFDVDTVLYSDQVFTDDIDNSFFHPMTSDYGKHIHTTRPFHRYNNTKTRSKVSISSLENHMDVNKELFLWSVLTGKQDFALLFWERGKNKICAALIATLIYKMKSRKEKDTRYNEFADEFEKLSVEIIEKFYRRNSYECAKGIIRQISQFGNMTWLDLAVMAEAKRFIAQRAVQDVLSDIWYGYIDHNVGNRMIIFSTIMLWYSGFLPYHHYLIEKTETIPQRDNSSHTASFIQCDISNTKYVIDKAINTKCTRLTKDILDEEEHTLDVNCWKKMKSGINRYLRNIVLFLHAPYVKYLYYLYSHIVFLLLFSYVILCDYFPLHEFRSDKCLSGSEENTNTDPITDQVNEQSTTNFLNLNNNKTKNETFEYSLQRYNRPSTTEILLTIWVFTLFCEEIRQLMSTELKSMYGKIVTYLSVFWNRLDALAISLFIIAFILRFWPTNQCFCAARIILAIDLSLWYIRILDIFAAVKRLGPKLVMIGEMVHDLTFFMLILTVFILAFGVPTYSLLYGVQKFNWHLPRAILNLAYWQIFGELEILDEIERNYEISGYVMFILLIAYMTVVSVLLVNLLIAMFSNTFDHLHMDTDCIWKFQHYYLVSHHLTRPSLPPPFIVFSHFWRVTLYFFSHIIKLSWFNNQYIQHNKRATFKIVVNEKLTRTIESIEDALGNEVYYSYSKTNRKFLDHQSDFHQKRIHSPQEILLNKISKLENQVQSMQTQQDNIVESLECLMNGIKKIGGDDIDIPKRHHFDSE